MFVSFLKKACLLPALLLLSLNGLKAQYTPEDISSYTDKITEAVRATLQEAAEKNTTDSYTLQETLRSKTGETSTTTKSPAIDLKTYVNEHLCEAQPAARSYIVRVKDILFPPTTGPTYPADVINAFRMLEAQIQGDAQLGEELRGQLMAYTQGLAKFVTTLQELHDKYPDYFDRNSTTGETYKGDVCKTWWCRWGKCTASVLGGALTGGLSGAVAGSAVPGVGTVAGGVVGAVGGGLTAAGQYCN